ncbi:hypothetical protein MBLNU459_g6378t1 [Dothideomycetes sp. NU459]
MNSKIEEAVQRAGSQVTFVNYDQYLDYFDGRYCTADVDESGATGANRPFLFFYEMKTNDEPFLPVNYDPGNPHDELRRRDDLSLNETLDATIGDWIVQTLDQYPDAELDDSIVNPDLDTEVNNAKTELRKRLKPRSYETRLLGESKPPELSRRGHFEDETIGEWIRQVLQDDPNAQVAEYLLDTDLAAYVEEAVLEPEIYLTDGIIQKRFGILPPRKAYRHQLD